MNNYKINDKCILTKRQILATGDWSEADYINSHEGFFWVHKSISEDEYTFYMKRDSVDGSTKIIEEDRKCNDRVLFDGYIKDLGELARAVDLLKLHEL